MKLQPVFSLNKSIHSSGLFVSLWALITEIECIQKIKNSSQRSKVMIQELLWVKLGPSCPPKRYWSPNPSTVNTILFGNRVFADDKVKMRSLGWALGDSVVKNMPAKEGKPGFMGSILGLGRSPGGRNGYPLQCSCLENSMDRGAWQAAIHGVTKSRTQLSNWTHMHAWSNVTASLYIEKIWTQEQTHWVNVM